VTRRLVLLHGQPGAASDWDAVVERLADDVRPLVLDRPGYRANPAPAGDFLANARAVLTELDAAGADDAVLVGHSYGGGVALSVARLAPQRVAGLVLVASVGPDCLNGWDRLLAAPVAGTVCALAAWWLTPWFARARLERIERLRNRPLEDDEYINWDVWGQARHAHGPMWRTFLTEQRALVRGLDDLVSALPSMSAPTLVLADPEDGMVPIATARALARLLPRAQLELIEEGGHHLPRQTPQAVADAIAVLLERVRC
jgi:pimeloyl-ACP methyl ester carboxylesterase